MRETLACVRRTTLTSATNGGPILCGLNIPVSVLYNGERGVSVRVLRRKVEPWDVYPSSMTMWPSSQKISKTIVATPLRSDWLGIFLMVAF